MEPNNLHGINSLTLAPKWRRKRQNAPTSTREAGARDGRIAVAVYLQASLAAVFSALAVKSLSWSISRWSQSRKSFVAAISSGV